MMEKFKEQVGKMEGNFDSSWGCDIKLNNLFFEYEKHVLSDHLLSLNHKKEGVIRMSSTNEEMKVSEHEAS